MNFPRLTACVALLAIWCAGPITAAEPPARHEFSIGKEDFLLDGKRLQIRCGELHFARIPRAYWQHRLRLCKAMGLNTVCAYLFWNFHEFEKGRFDWSGQADAAEFCRLAQAEGLWVILRPGPYSCAEWDMGGLPWWLLKKDGIQLRSRDPDFLAASRLWLREVGRVLGPLQVTRGGPILMVQAENEYGFFGGDAGYMGEIRQSLLDAGFNVPLFACNPMGVMRRGFRKDLFNVVNFGSNPEGNFKKLRAMQPEGPLMCGEFYPGWFDTFGAKHHYGNTPKYLRDLQTMLEANASFSIYMAHGGTSFGLWAGMDRPCKPDTTSYDYDAPISEAGWIGEKFQLTRELFRKHLLPGETIPEPPPPHPVTTIPRFTLTETAPVFDNLPAPVSDDQPRHIEAYDQGQGCILYRTTLPAGPAGVLSAEHVGDFAWIFLDGKPAGVMDRRSRSFQTNLPARATAARLDVLVEAMGHVNFGMEIHDRKGLHAPVRFTAPGQGVRDLTGWQIFPLRLNAPMLQGLRWTSGKADGPSFWRGFFDLQTPADTFLDTSTWGKGVLWVNGHCLGRFWNIGPTQTMYLPSPWLKAGRNEVIVLDLTGPTSPTLAGVEKPVLDLLRPGLDFAKVTSGKKRPSLSRSKPSHSGTFANNADPQEVRLAQAVAGRQFCLEILNAHDGQPYSAIAELDVLGPDGKSLPHAAWTIAFAESQETAREDGSALNAIDGQTANFWHTVWSTGSTPHPHLLIIDLGATSHIGGFRYTPRADVGNKTPGRIKDYRVHIGDALVSP